MFTATSRRGRDVSAIRRSWVPSPFPTSRITPPVGRAEASVATSRRQACSASRSEPGPSHSPRFSQPGATARKKSGPMLSYTRAAGFPPCLSTPAACRACWAVQPAIHAGLAAISHPPSTGGFPATGLTTRHWIHRDGSASRRRHNRTCQKGHAHRPRQQPGVRGQVPGAAGSQITRRPGAAPPGQRHLRVQPAPAARTLLPAHPQSRRAGAASADRCTSDHGGGDPAKHPLVVHFLPSCQA